jgi:hypothetical protein
MYKAICFAGLTAAILALPPAVVAADPEATVKVWITDTSGRPPFKRRLVELPAADIAAMETSMTTSPAWRADNATIARAAVVADTEATFRFWITDTSGRPPFKRSLIELPAADVAAMEMTAATAPSCHTDFSGRPPFKRRTGERCR